MKRHTKHTMWKVASPREDNGLQGLTDVGLIFLSLSGVFLITFSYFYFLANTSAKVTEQQPDFHVIGIGD